MKIKRIWIEYEDERCDRYMAPASEADITVWLAEKAISGGQGEPSFLAEISRV
jgi:hypothetical protein